jgi:hypothetical protein
MSEVNDKALGNIMRDLFKEKVAENKQRQADHISSIKQSIGVPDKPIRLSQIMKEVVEKDGNDSTSN